MMHAYSEIYLEGAMIRLGDMLEHAVLDCRYDPDGFWNMFIQSSVSKRFEAGDISLVAGKSGAELAFLVLYECENLTTFTIPSWREYRSPLFWCGWTLCYFQWHENIPFKRIWEAVSIRTLQKMYPALHEADISKSVKALNALIKPRAKTPVMTLRLVRNLSQKELAERAGMSISQLQRLEYGERSVENLSLKTALSLASALGVEADEIC
ncbi:MAG: helix-turn-helix domain-containing protein [Sphaerochaetaceae bacterium]|nr:helix-turn-helix domain-containing protein [Sphaerochaetaceae bacterium]